MKHLKRIGFAFGIVGLIVSLIMILLRFGFFGLLGIFAAVIFVSAYQWATEIWP